MPMGILPRWSSPVGRTYGSGRGAYAVVLTVEPGLTARKGDSPRRERPREGAETKLGRWLTVSATKPVIPRRQQEPRTVVVALGHETRAEEFVTFRIGGILEFGEDLEVL